LTAVVSLNGHSNAVPEQEFANDVELDEVELEQPDEYDTNDGPDKQIAFNELL
jgi:hypothetical protein